MDDMTFSRKAASLDSDFHALAQPLSSLQCRLEIGLIQDNTASTREMVEESLRELRRVTAGVAHIRAVLQEAVSEGRIASASR